MATALARLMQSRGLKGITLLTAVQPRAPQDFWLNFELGSSLFHAHRPNEALGYVRAALALRPQSGAAHNSVGAVLQDMGRVDEAIDQYHVALNIDPKYAEAHYNLGDALRSEGKLDEAIGHLREAIAAFPNFTDAYIDLAVALQDQNRMDEAIDLLNQAIRLDPRNAKAHNDLGIILRLENRLDEAIIELRKAVELDPKYAIARINLGEALWVRGRLDEAIEHIQQAARLDAPDADAEIFLCHHLYVAAHNAVQETLGGRAGKPPLDRAAQARLRLRALDWLRASLNLVIKLVDSGRGQPSSLFTWENEPVLSAVRDPPELAKLPAAEREQWRHFWAIVGAEIVTDPVTQARERAAQGDWSGAASKFARALARGPINDGHFWFEYAAVQLLSGNKPGYASACAELIDRCGKPGGPRAYHAARAGTLASDSAPDPSLLRRIAHNELQDNALQFWSLTEQGAVAFRAGEFEKSVSLFKQSLAADQLPGRAVINWLWLALAEQRLGKTDEARRWLNKAQGWLDESTNGMTLNAERLDGLDLRNWLEANVLRREAEVQIGSSASSGPVTYLSKRFNRSSVVRLCPQLTRFLKMNARLFVWSGSRE
jgi:tetratricopeptide (TPR) repeat protein